MTAPSVDLASLLDVIGERAVMLLESGELEGSADPSTAYVPGSLIQDPGAASDEPCIGRDALPAALLQLAAFAGLDDTDLALLLVSAALSLDVRFEPVFTLLNNDAESSGPSVATAFRLVGARLDDPLDRARLAPGGMLRARGLLTPMRTDRVLPLQILATPERVTAFLLGDGVMDDALRGVLRPMTVTEVPAASLPDFDWDPSPQATGAVMRARVGTAGRLQAQRVLDPALLLDGSALGRDEPAWSAQVRAAIQEATLRRQPLIVDLREAPVPADACIALLDRSGALFVALVPPRAVLPRWSGLVVELPLPTLEMRRAWWSALNPGLAHLAETVTHIEPEDIPQASARLANGAAANRARLEGLARIVEPELVLADVVIDDAIAAQLRSLRDRVRFRGVVLDEWGLRPGGSRGRGITALFAGASGTGKTMSAEALAGELGVPLFHVDLSSVVDKYIGETEKNLDRIFAAVESVDGVLLFDEADALFGKRSSTSDAKDRYANIEVAYLLQRMESFDGLAILTTNLRSNVDAAFLRRLDAVVDFPEPDAAERLRIWERVLDHPSIAAGSGMDAWLAQLPVSGGSIRAILVSAAYLAAAAERPIGPQDLIAGARLEWQKLGRLAFPLEEPVLAASGGDAS